MLINNPLYFLIRNRELTMNSPNIPEWFNTTVETDLDINLCEDSDSCFDNDPDFLEIVEDQESFYVEFYGALMVLKEDEEDIGDSDVSDDLLSNDLEKTNAVVAAFTVVIIFTLFFLEIGATFVFMIIVTHGGQQDMLIAHSQSRIQ